MKNLIGISNPLILAIVTTLIFMSAGTAMAAVWTDQADYSPGSNVTIHGDNSDNAGYRSGEIVNVSVNGPYQYDSKCSGTADSNGAWSCQITLSSDYTAEGNYTYTAVGQTSDKTQSGTFTDSVLNVTMISPTTASPVTITSLPATVTISFKYNTSTTGSTNGAASVQLTTSVSNTKTLVSGTGKSDSIDVTIPSGTANGQYTAKIQVSNGGSKVDTQTQAVIINVPPANISFATNGLSSGESINISYSGTNSIGSPISGWDNFTSPGPSTNIGTKPGSPFTYSGFPMGPIISGGQYYYLNSITPGCTNACMGGSYTITTGDPGTTTTVTGNYYVPHRVDIVIEGVPSGTNVGLTIGYITPWGTTVPPGTPAFNAPGGSIYAKPSTAFQYAVSGSVTVSGATYNLDSDSPISPFSTGAAGGNTTLTITYKAADSTPPIITPTVTGTIGNNGWYISDIKVSWDVSDSESTISSSSGCGDSIINTDTPGITLTCTAASDGGTSSQSVTIKRDATPPTINASAATSDGTYTPGTWTNKDVIVSFTCEDVMSGVAACTSPQIISSERTDQYVIGSVTDNAGNTNTTKFSGINIDKTAPVTEDDAPANWQNVSFGVTLTCTDTGGSGCKETNYTIDGGALQKYTSPISITTEGNYTIIYYSVDNAGNQETAKTAYAKLDKTPPEITASAKTADGNAYTSGTWTNQSVTVNFTCSDDLSGIASCPDSQTVSSEGKDQSVTGTAKDNAGNYNTTSFSGIDIDKTAPIINIVAPAGNYILNQPAAASYSCSDGLSGVAICSGTVANGENVDTGSIGSKIFTVVTTDNAGNSGSNSSSYNIQYSSTLGRTILSPLQQVSDSSNLTKSYKIGSVIPIKFQLADFNGAYIGTATATLSIFKVNDSTDPNDVEVSITSAGLSDTGNLFRYDPVAQQYIYNLKTTGFTVGYYRLTVSLDDSTRIVTYFEMKK